MIAVQCFPEARRTVRVSVTAWAIPSESHTLWAVRRRVQVSRSAHSKAEAVRLVGEALCQLADQLDAERE